MQEGGLVASRGFLVQAIVALLESLRRRDWTEVVIEPNVGGDAVDILWTLPGGQERCSQVKSQLDPITLNQATTWAAKLRATRPLATHQLHLCGIVSRDLLRKLKEPLGGVEIVIGGHDLAAITALCVRALHALLDDRQQYGQTDVVLGTAIERLAGLLFAGTARRRLWTPDDLWKEVIRAVAVDTKNEAAKALSWRQTRIIELQANGDSVETYVAECSNSSNSFIATDFILQVTDSDNRIEAVHTGGASPRWEAGPLAGIYTVWIAQREVAPAEKVRFAFRVRRSKVAEILNDELSYADAALPFNDTRPCPCNIFVLMPWHWHGMSLTALGAEFRSKFVALWSIDSAGFKRFSVSAKSANEGDTTASDPFANGLRQYAFAAVGRPFEAEMIAAVSNLPGGNLLRLS